MSRLAVCKGQILCRRARVTFLVTLPILMLSPSAVLPIDSPARHVPRAHSKGSTRCFVSPGKYSRHAGNRTSAGEPLIRVEWVRRLPPGRRSGVLHRRGRSARRVADRAFAPARRGRARAHGRDMSDWVKVAESDVLQERAKGTDVADSGSEPDLVELLQFAGELPQFNETMMEETSPGATTGHVHRFQSSRSDAEYVRQHQRALRTPVLQRGPRQLSFGRNQIGQQVPQRRHAEHSPPARRHGDCPGGSVRHLPKHADGLLSRLVRARLPRAGERARSRGPDGL